jgi:hypothetical protein
MKNKLFFLVGFLLFTISAYAHSGRLDGYGGHKVNKEWVYDGQYIEIEKNIPYLERGTIIFKAGDYHFHCKPSLNKIDLTTYRDGIYLPVSDREEVVDK